MNHALNIVIATRLLLLRDACHFHSNITLILIMNSHAGNIYNVFFCSDREKMGGIKQSVIWWLMKMPANANMSYFLHGFAIPAKKK